MSTAARSRKSKAATGGATAARAVVQMLAVTGKRFTLEELRERLREFYREEPGEAVRAAAALSAMDLLSALLDLNTALAGAGLQVRVVNGLVSLGTTRPESEKLREYLERETPEGAEELTPALMEVLSLIAFRRRGRLTGSSGGAAGGPWWRGCGRWGWWRRFPGRAGGFSSRQHRGFSNASPWNHWRSSEWRPIPEAETVSEPIRFIIGLTARRDTLRRRFPALPQAKAEEISQR